MNRGNISFSYIEGRVWAGASKRHNVLFMQPGKTVREGCRWSGKWRAATECTKLTALPGQPQFPLNWWPIFSSQRKEREGERGAKKKALHLCHLTLAEATRWSLTLPNEGCILCWRTGEGALMMDPGAAAPNPAACCTCQPWVLPLGEKRIFQNGKTLGPKRTQNSIMVTLRTILRRMFSGCL